MSSLTKARLREFGESHEGFEEMEVSRLIVEAGERLASAVQDDELVGECMTNLFRAISPDSKPQGDWREIWTDTSDGSLASLPLTQAATSLSAYAYFGLSPAHDGNPCGLSDIAAVVANVRRAVAASRREPVEVSELERTVLAAEGRLAMDQGLGVTPEQLAALAQLGMKSIRNALSPSSGSGLNVQEGKISAESAITWLTGRGEFKSSIWQVDEVEHDEVEGVTSIEGAIHWVPFAKDGTMFDPHQCMRAGAYTVGPKGAERSITDYGVALAELARMRPNAYWRRPNSAGNWGIVTAVGFRPMAAAELKI